MNSFKSRLWDFLGSMRLAISLLSVLAIASAIGTLVKQNQPMVNYIDQFVFWAQWFATLGLYDVYNQAWFLVILTFLLASTSVCLIRNTPKMLHDMRVFKNHTRTNSLRHLHEHHEWVSDEPMEQLTQRAADVFDAQGYTLRAQKNEVGTYLAAKRGRFNRFGYILTHLAIIVICLGGLLDSELSIRAQVALFGKVPQANAATYKQVPAQGILSSNTLSYRGNINLPEGAAADYVELTYDQNHYLLQELPFAIRLNQFVVDYYSTGMPKRFASNVTVQDKETGQSFDQTIEVNHPLRYKGVAVYQASFADGGSALNLEVFPLNGTVAAAAKVDAVMFQNHKINYGGKNYTIEWREFKPMTIEPFDEQGGGLGAGQGITPLSHAMRPTGANQKFKNLGPTLGFILRDEQNDALEFRNYMNPIMLNNFPVFVSGVRNDPNKDFEYFGIPADAEQTPNDFMRLRAALADSALRERAVANYVKTLPASAAITPEQLTKSAQKTIDLFSQGGKHLENWLLQTPVEQRDVVVKFAVSQLEGTLWQLMQIARTQAQLPVLPENDYNKQFMRIATERLTQDVDYGAPVYVQLAGFKQVQASVLQMTRSPGQFWVYLGSLMLVLGTLAMTFIRERRVWLHILPQGGQHRLVLAMSSTRRTLDYQRAWTSVQNALTKPAASTAPTAPNTFTPKD